MSEPVLVVRARRLRAARGVVVARDVTLDAAPGDVVAVEGPNGSGKSTLLAAAAGLLPADGASVRPGSVGYSPERAGVLPRIRGAGLASAQGAASWACLVFTPGRAPLDELALRVAVLAGADAAAVRRGLDADHARLGGQLPPLGGSPPAR